MKKLIATVLVAITLSNVAMADCDFKTGVEKLPDGRFAYSSECHIKVGEMKRDNGLLTTQVADYQKVIELKDLALTKANERADLWMNASFKLQDRMNAVDELKSKNQLLTFFAGVAVTGLAVWGAGQLVKR